MKPSLACLAGLLFGAQAAFCTPFDLAAIVGGVTYYQSVPFSTWPTPAGGGFVVSNPLGGSIWLFTSTTFGLTDTRFTCSDPNCTGFQFSFIVLGELNSNLSSVGINISGDALDASGGDASFDARYYVTCSGPYSCPIISPVGDLLVLSGQNFSKGGSVYMAPLSGLGLVNYQITWNIVPSGGGTVPYGTTLSLPGSLEVTEEIPEPAMGMLVGLGLAGVFALRREIPVNR